MKRLLIALGMVLTASLTAQAQGNPGVTLGLPGYGGNGCPQGSVSATLSPDATTLSILFDQYVVEAGGNTGVPFGRKSCNVSIPVNVPQGLSISIVSVDYRGFNNLPPGARSQFNVEYFFAGSQGPAFRRNFFGPLSEDYLIHNELIAEAIVWSACGASPLLRTNASLSAFANQQRQYTMATVDSEDVAVALVFSLRWRRC